MKVIDVVVAKTSSTEEVTDLPELVGKALPAAFLMNYGGYGFAKFRFDERSLAVFEASLWKIESLDERKRVYNMLYDNVKSMRVAGSQALSAIKTSLPHEKSEENLSDCLRKLVPSLIAKYMPLETYEKDTAEMFEMTLGIIESRRFVESESTSQLLVKTVLDFAERDDHVSVVEGWFAGDGVCEVVFTKEI
jgi:aminopeptidase N